MIHPCLVRVRVMLTMQAPACRWLMHVFCSLSALTVQWGLWYFLVRAGQSVAVDAKCACMRALFVVKKDGWGLSLGKDYGGGRA